MRSLCLSFFIACGFLLMTSPANARMIDEAIKTQTLYINNGAEPETLDPSLIQGNTERDLVLALFEGLTVYDAKTLEPKPGVAKSWKISEDGLVYTFHLRNNAKWSNGTKITAHDFVKSWKRFLEPELAAVYSFLLHPVKNAKEYNTGKIKDFKKVGIKAKDDHTFQVTLNKPVPYFLSLTAFQTLVAVPTAEIQKHGDLNDRANKWTRPDTIVSSGPFRVKSWVVNDKIIAEKNPHYWDAANVKLNQIVFYPIDNLQTGERMFRSGEIHKTKDIHVNKIPTYQKKNPEALHLDTYLSNYFYVFNTKVKPLDNPKVRQAFAFAINRKLLTKYVTKGGQVPASAMTPPNTNGFTAQIENLDNPEKAKKLLAEAGYPNGKGFPKVTLLYNTLEKHKIIAEAIQQMWKKNLNVEVELVNQDWKVYLASLNNNNFMIARRGWVGDYNDPNTFLDMLMTNNSLNFGKWSNAEFDQAMMESQNTSDHQKRLSLFQKAEEIAHKEMPLLPLYFDSRTYLIHSSVKGWHENVMDMHPFKGLYLAKDN